MDCSIESLEEQVETGESLIGLIKDVTCHNTLVELGVKNTSEACAKHITHEQQASSIVITKKRREKFGTTSKKSDF